MKRGAKMKDKNKECPFCGDKVDPEGWLSADDKRGPECEGCGATTPDMDTWNTRTPLQNTPSDSDCAGE